MRVLNSVVLSLFILLSGCASQQVSPVTDKAGVPGPLPLPAVYSTPLPCADCLQHTLYLTLQPGGLYFLRSETVKDSNTEPTVKAEFGIWKYVSGTQNIALSSYNSQRTLLITPNQTIRVVSETGSATKTGLQTELHPAAEAPVTTEVVLVQGMYFHEDGRAIVRECLTDTSYTVIQDGDYPVLEHRYATTPRGQDAPLLVSFKGRFTPLVDEDGLVEEPAVQPVQFVDVHPGIGCNGMKSNTTPLTGVTWYLTELLGKPIQLAEKQKRPRILLGKEKRRVKGFGGCNTFTGTYFRMGDVFLFNKRIGQRRACVEGLELEFDFFNVLSATDGFHIEGNILEFRDRERNILARFEQASGQ
jgi:heat shock protein HslJ